MSKETIVPSIPEVPVIQDSSLRKFLQSVKEVLQVREGNKGSPLDANATFRDLVDAGLALDPTGEHSASSNPATRPTVKPPTYTSEVDLTTPPPVENFNVAPSIESVFLTWTASAQKGHAFTEIFRNAIPSIPSTPIGRAVGTMYVDHTASGENYYWARHVSQAGKYGEFTTVEHKAAPGSDPANVITAMKNAGIAGVSGLPYYYVSETFTVQTGDLAGTVIPAGTYINSAMIANASISNAMIKDAAITSAKIEDASITNAKIASLDATKIDFDLATGKVLSAAIITGGDISGVEIHGSHIWAGGSQEEPNIEINDTGTMVAYNMNQSGPTRDYTTFADGEVTKSFYVPNYGFTSSNMLSQVETGVAESGTAVTLSKYYKNIPYIMVSPNNLSVFNPQYFDNTQTDNPRQSIQVSASVERSSEDPNSILYYTMKVTPRATLSVDATNFSFPGNSESWSKHPLAAIWSETGGYFGTGGYVQRNEIDTGPFSGVHSVEFVTLPEFCDSATFTVTMRGYSVIGLHSGDLFGHRGATHTVETYVDGVLLSTLSDTKSITWTTIVPSEFYVSVNFPPINAVRTLEIRINSTYLYYQAARVYTWPGDIVQLVWNGVNPPYGTRWYKRSRMSLGLTAGAITLPGTLNYLVIGG